MPKPEILDPQGKAGARAPPPPRVTPFARARPGQRLEPAVGGALAGLGFTEFAGARQGKRFELEVEGDVTEAVLERAAEAARTLLSNPVIEDVVRVSPA